MKKVNILCIQWVLFLSFVPLLSTAQNIWTGSLIIGNWDNYQSIDATQFSNANVGDILQITSTNIEMNSAQLSLNNGSWEDLAGSGMVDLRSESYAFIITSVMLSEMQSGGVLVRGKNFTLTSVDLIPGEGNYQLQNAIWLGETVIGNWEGYQAISAGSFLNSQEGNLLRVKVKDVGENAQGHLSNSSWGDLIDAEAYVDLSGISYYEFTITPPMLAEIKANGILVRGANYTVEGVYIIDPLATRTDLNKEVSRVSICVKDKQLFLRNLPAKGVVHIYNLNGDKIREINISDTFMSVSLQNNGIYIIEVRSENSKYTNKIVVE